MKEKVKTIAFMTAVATVFTAVVSGVHLATKRRTALNKDAARRRAILHVLGIEPPAGAGPEQLERFYNDWVEDTGITLALEQKDRVRLPRDDPFCGHVLAGYGERGGKRTLVGYVIGVNGTGLWGPINGFIALAPDRKTVKGITFYDQQETAGLGAEIAGEGFRRKFENRLLPDEPDPAGVLIELVPPDRELAANQVHAVTGATATSDAVETFLNAHLRAFQQAMRGYTPKGDVP